MAGVALDDLSRPEAFARRYPDVVGSVSRLRYQLRNRNSNGLAQAGAVVERGRQLWVVVPKYRDWLIGQEVDA